MVVFKQLTLPPRPLSGAGGRMRPPGGKRAGDRCGCTVHARPRPSRAAKRSPALSHHGDGGGEAPAWRVDVAAHGDTHTPSRPLRGE